MASGSGYQSVVNSTFSATLSNDDTVLVFTSSAASVATTSSATTSTPLSVALVSASHPSPGNKKRSILWTYFSKLNEKEARCNSCGMKISTAGNTTNMMKVIINK
jgi:hypothetical protein